MRNIIILLSALVAHAVLLAQTPVHIESVLLPDKSSLVSFRFLFQTGSAFDPAGKEGVASLTAALIAKGGSRQQTYDAIIKAMYPMATSFEWQVDKEMTVFTGATHLENLDKYYGLISQMLLDPGFREDDFTRLKSDAINFLKVSLRDGNDEELAKEELYNLIYARHSYGHHNMGTISSLEKLTLEDVKQFYRENYSRDLLVLGLAGGYPTAFPDKVRNDLGKLPEGKHTPPQFSSPEMADKWQVEIIERETRATAISFGFPISVRRGDKDWPALYLVASWLGQHRSSNSHLYQKLREARGLNYGDYSYVEYFPRGMFQFQPDPNQARHQQIFQIWIRPVQPPQAHFALRAALYEYKKLLEEGLTAEDFEATRQFLLKYANVLTQTADNQLGYALDSKFYGIEEYTSYLKKELSKLTLNEVNSALKKHLHDSGLQIVIVTKDAAELKKQLVADASSPITYNSPKSPAILEEDKTIEKLPLKLSTDQIKITPVSEVFAK